MMLSAKISILGIACGIFVGLITVLIAANAPAKHAAKVSPITAVSGNAGIPMQRIIPKNLVLCATLLFILLEIIKTPAIKINKNRTTATERRVCPIELPSKSPIEKLPCLPTNRNHLPSQLSGGQQQRVAIGRALITRPSLVLADEPTGNLDSQNSSEVITLLKETSKKYEQTIIMITHNRSIAQTADQYIAASCDFDGGVL